jgi:hypothetical protein
MSKTNLTGRIIGATIAAGLFLSAPIVATATAGSASADPDIEINIGGGGGGKNHDQSDKNFNPIRRVDRVLRKVDPRCDLIPTSACFDFSNIPVGIGQN